jgi:hypothetical protein
MLVKILHNHMSTSTSIRKAKKVSFDAELHAESLSELFCPLFLLLLHVKPSQKFSIDQVFRQVPARAAARLLPSLVNRRCCPKCKSIALFLRQALMAVSLNQLFCVIAQHKV